MAGEEFISQLPEKTTAINSTDELIVNSGGTTHRIKAEKFKGTPGEDGNPGLDGNPGTPGKDAYQIWLDAGNTGSKAVFLESLNGTDGTDGEDGTPGSNGKDAYQLWIELGNTGTEQDFLNSLNGTNGEDGKDGVEFDYRGEYDSGTSYDKGHVVISAGSGYVSLIDGNVGNLPQFPSVKWGLISAKGVDGEGAGDMIGANNLSELTDVGVARVKLDIYSKSEVDTKLGDYSLTTHNHNLADLSEKDYASLDNKPDLTIYSLVADIKDDLVSIDTNKSLSANQGKILKGLIDNINTLLTSDDTTLDEIQEIVDYIKQNKDDLANLSIGNIAGLQDALNSKQTTANLLTAFQGTPDDTHYISEKLAKDSLDAKANLSGGNTFSGDQILNNSLKFGNSIINNGGNDRLKFYALRDVGSGTGSAYEIYTNNGGANVGRYYITGRDHKFKNYLGENILTLGTTESYFEKNIRYNSNIVSNERGIYKYRQYESLGSSAGEEKTLKDKDGNNIGTITNRTYRVRGVIMSGTGGQSGGEWQIKVNHDNVITLNKILGNYSGQSLKLYEDSGIVKAMLYTGSQNYSYALHIEEIPQDLDFWYSGNIKHYPTLLNDWGNFGGGWAGASYYKDTSGIVHITGLVKNGTDDIVFVLPEDFRPKQGVIKVVSKDSADDTDGFCRLNIESSGIVKLMGYSTTWTSITCSFNTNN